MIIYGINPVFEAIKAGRVKEIRVAQRADDRLQKLLEEAARSSVRMRFVTRDELDHDSKRGVHQGVVADVERRTEATLADLAKGENGPPLIVVLDEVEDPQNVGAILRSVDASGGIGGRPANPTGGAPRRRRGQGLGGCREPRAGGRRRQYRPVARGAEKSRHLDGGTRRRRKNGLL